jgi:hypothetical protein
MRCMTRWTGPTLIGQPPSELLNQRQLQTIFLSRRAHGRHMLRADRHNTFGLRYRPDTAAGEGNVNNLLKRWQNFHPLSHHSSHDV